MTVQDDDQLLVCRNTNPYNLKSQNVMAELLDDDLMVVCRNGIPYKATGLEIKESIGPQEVPPSLTSAVLTEDTPGGSRFDNQSFTSTLNWATKGVPEASLEMKATVTGTLEIAGTTDEIVGIGTGWNQSQTWSSNVTGSVTAGYEGVNAFNGDTSSAGWLAAVSSTSTWTTSYSVTSSVRLYLFSENADQADAGSVDITVNGNTEAIPNVGEAGGRWVTAFTGSGTLTKIENKMQSNINKYVAVRAIEVDGVWLVDAGVPNSSDERILTLASDANLANGVFKAGDAVKQNNSPIVPVSSEITNVGTGTSVYSSEITGTADPSWPKTGAFDGVLTTAASPGSSGTSLVWTPTTPIPCLTGWRYRQYVSAPGSSQLLMNGVAVSVSPTATNAWSSMYSPPAGGLINSVQWFRDSGSNAIDVAAIEVDGTILVDGAPFTQLTLQDASGLSDFEVGDVVQSDWNQSQEWSTVGTVTGAAYSPDSDITKAFDGNITTGSGALFAQTNNFVQYVFNPPIAISAASYFITMDGGSIVFNVGESDEVTDTVTGSAVAERQLSLTSGVLKSFKATTNGSSQGAYLWGLKANSKLLVDSSVVDPDAAKITAIDPAAPSITTDGGSWKGSDGTGDTGWDKRQTWSDDTTLVGSLYGPSYTPSELFDGSLTGACLLLNSSSNLTVNIDPPLAFTDKVEVYYTNGISESTFQVNGVDQTFLVNYADRVWQEAENISSPFSSFKFTGTNGANGPYVYAIRVDGNLLVNPDIPGGPPMPQSFVSGPIKLITATFVSADPLVPSMTVSDVVGPWSANTGNYVVNTVVNPIMIKPETSAIAGVAEVTNTYTDNLSANQPWAAASPETNAFDGDAFTLAALDSGAADATITWDASSYNLSTDNGNVVVRSATTTVNWEVTGSLGTSTVSAVSDPAGGALPTVGILQTLKVVGPAASLMFVQAGGVILTDGAGVTTLTLTDDTDLAQFATGDAVYAAGVAPASFAPVIWTGTGGTRSIATGFAPDLVWLKSRSVSNDHNLFDSVRGVERTLSSNLTSAEVTQPTHGYVTSFDAAGFSVAPGGDDGDVNFSGRDYVAWCWSAGGTTVTNNDGTIESQVRSNGDFSIVKYTGVGATVESFGHGLNSAPGMVIVKDLDVGYSWVVYNQGMGLKVCVLNLSEVAYTDTSTWNSAPTDSVVNIGGGANVSDNGTEFIAYCWADSPTQNFGSYAGNGLDDGPVIDCGFEPAFVMIKNTTAAGTFWTIFDNKRGSGQLYPNEAQSESYYPGNTTDPRVTLTSTGFKCTSAQNTFNGDGDTMIYAAFASAGGPSGVVGDITGLDMTLSESTGTWEVGQKVTMDEKPAIETTANLIFDSTGAVTGLSTQPVAGQLMSNKDTLKLTFGDGAGTGETWDEELPAGTHLQTSFVATNVEGTSSATSNEITP